MLSHSQLDWLLSKIKQIKLTSLHRKGNSPMLLVEMYITTGSIVNRMEIPQNPRNRATV